MVTAYGSANPMKVVIDLIVDDGVPSRGHRTNIFQPRLRVMGGACGPHRRYRIMCTIDYAGGFVDATVGEASTPEQSPIRGRINGTGKSRRRGGLRLANTGSAMGEPLGQFRATPEAATSARRGPSGRGRRQV